MEEKQEQDNDTISFESSRFGKLEVKRSALIEVVFGLIGFAEFKNYVLLEYNPPFCWLHSIDNPELAFVVVNSAEFGENYSIPIPVGDKDIDLQEEDSFALFNLVSIRQETALSTVNLKAPVIVNMRNRKGRQVIIDSQSFSTRHPLWGKEAEIRSEEK